MFKNFLSTWLEEEQKKGLPKNIKILWERDGGREAAESTFSRIVQDHFVGIEIIESIGGFTKAASVIRNALPTDKITRSGDFGEIFATEYVDQYTAFTVPIRRLRYKDDRAVAMRGDDVLGFDFGSNPPRVLKVEAKSRVNLTPSVVQEAGDALRRHCGRPNPSTLSFVSRRLRETQRHDLAESVEQLQEANISTRSVEHLIFTVSENDPAGRLTAHARSSIRGVRRNLAGCRIKAHTKFIQSVFDRAAEIGAPNGNGRSSPN